MDWGCVLVDCSCWLIGILVASLIVRFNQLRKSSMEFEGGAVSVEEFKFQEVHV